MGFSFLHISDIHLGRAFSDLSVYTDKMQTCNNACFKAFNKIIDLAIDKHVDFVLVAGDSFDNEENDLQSKILFVKNLQKLADNGIKSYIICGNHDSIETYKKNKNYFNFDKKYDGMINITGVTTDSCCETFNYNDIVDIHTLSFEKEEGENPCTLLKNTGLNTNMFNIGLIHCDLDKTTSKYSPCSREDLKNLGYDYYALGHIHIPQDFDNIVYAGSPQGRTKKETGEHGCFFIQADDNKNIKKEFITTDFVRFSSLDLDCSNYKNTIEVFDEITELVNNTVFNDVELSLFEINLVGITNAYKDLAQNELLSEYINSNSEKELNNAAVYKINNYTHPEINKNKIENDRGIIGIIYNTIQNSEKFYNNVAELHQNIYKQSGFSPKIRDELLNCLDMDKEEFKEKIENEIKSLCKELYSVD